LVKPVVPIRLLAIHQGGGLGGAPVSLLKLLSRLPPEEIQPSVVFTEFGPVLEYATGLHVSASIVHTGGAFFYSAHAQLGPRTLARFIRTFPSAVRRARSVLHRSRPDLLHLNTSVLLAWAAAARRERVPVVWVVREVLGPEPHLRRWHASFIQRHAVQIVAVSDAVRACFPPQARVRRVYNAVDLAEFRLDLLAQAPLVRAELGLESTDPVVMAIGSVQRAKGHWLLLDAFERLEDPRPHLVLVAGGAGRLYARGLRGRIKTVFGVPLDNLDAWLREARRRRLAERIVVTGFRRDVARVLVAADVLAFPSLAAEGFGRPIIEAMAMQRPVVATDVGRRRACAATCRGPGARAGRAPQRTTATDGIGSRGPRAGRGVLLPGSPDRGDDRGLSRGCALSV
jgi:glycosyltransferase involved in cell wall biosynthesis